MDLNDPAVRDRISRLRQMRQVGNVQHNPNRPPQMNRIGGGFRNQGIPHHGGGGFRGQAQGPNTLRGGGGFNPSGGFDPFKNFGGPQGPPSGGGGFFGGGLGGFLQNRGFSPDAIRQASGNFGSLQQGPPQFDFSRGNQSQGAMDVRNAVGLNNEIFQGGNFGQQGNFQDPNSPFAGAMPGAQNQLNNLFGGQGLFQPGQNPFLGMGQQMLQQGGPQAPGLPQMPGSPDLQRIGGFQQPQLQQFDPNSIQAFNPQQVQSRDVQAQQITPQQVQAQQIAGGRGDFGGPQQQGPGFQDIVNTAQGLSGTGGAGQLPREQLQQERFGLDPLSQESFRSAQAINQELGQGGGGIDLDAQQAQENAANQALFEQAARAGRINAGGRGFGLGGGGTVGDTAVARELAPVLAGAMQRQNDRNFQGQQFNVGQRAGAAGRLGQLGSASASALQGTQGLNLQGQQGANQLGVQQRGQDIGAALQSAGMNTTAQNINALSNLQGTLGGLNNQAFGLGTQRGLGQAGLDQGAQLANQQTGLQAGLANQAAGLQAGQSNQQAGLQAGLANQQAGLQAGLANQGAGLQANQQRIGEIGTVGGLQNQFNQLQGNLGLGFAGLNQQGQQMNNQNMLNLFGQQSSNALGMGGLANQQFGTQAGMFGDMLGAAGNFGNIQQQGGIAAGNQQLQAGQLAMGLMNGSSQAIQHMNQLQQAAAAGDQNARMQLFLADRAMQENRRQFNKQNSGGGFGGFLGGVVGTGLGAFTGGLGTAAGTAAGNAIGGLF